MPNPRNDIKRAVNNARATMPAITARYTEDEVYEVFDKYAGNNANICAALDCTRQQLSKWLSLKQDRKERLEKSRELLVFKSEEAMLKLLECDDPRVVADVAKYILKCQGRSRGWHGDAPSITQTIVADKDKGIQIRSVFGLPPEEQEQQVIELKDQEKANEEPD